MSNRVDYEGLLCLQNLVDNPVIANPELEETGELTAQGLRSNGIEILCKPPQPRGDTVRDRAIEPCKLARRRIEDAQAVHRSGKTEPSRYISEGFATLAALDG